VNVRTARYGKLIRGWDWRTSHERLTKAEARAKQLGLSRTQYLEYCIDKESGMDNPTFEIKTIDGCEVATVTYGDGTTFTTDDWQGQQPQDASEIEQYEWRKVSPADPANTGDWTPAILILGWPRVIV
jgi:hypothetical protein